MQGLHQFRKYHTHQAGFFSREWVGRRVVGGSFLNYYRKRSGFTTYSIMWITRESFLGFQDLIFLWVCTAPHTELGETDPPKEQHCPQKQNRNTEPRNYSHHLLAVRLDCTENQTQLQLPKAQLLPEYLQWSHLPILSHSLYQKDHEAFYCWSAIRELNV